MQPEVEFEDLPPATTTQLHVHRDVLERLAAEHGMRNLRVSPQGRLLATLDDDRTYFDVGDFEAAAAAALGAAVEFTPDGVLRQPGHTRDLDAAVAL